MSVWATEALRRELKIKDVKDRSGELERQERLFDFAGVAKSYRVIEGETFIVVVDREIVRRLVARERVKRQELVSGSVQMWRNKIRSLAIEPISGRDELYQWNGPYDPEFLGYMKGVLPLIEGRDSGLYA